MMNKKELFELLTEATVSPRILWFADSKAPITGYA